MDRKHSTEPVFDGQVRMIVRFDGMLDESRLAKAVRLAFDAEPVTGCRLVEKPLRLYWQRCSDLDSAFNFKTVDFSDEDKAINDFLFSPLDPFLEPQAKVCLIRARSDTLVNKMTHIVADGGASFEYLRLLSGIYRRLEKEPEYRPACNLRGSRNSFQVLKHVDRKTILSSCRHISVGKPTWKFAFEGDGETSPKTFIRHIDPGRLSHIKDHAKKHDATMGDILMAAYYRALFELIDPPENVPLSMLVPVNLRRYLPDGRAEGICSLTAGYFPEIARIRHESFEGTITRVHDVMVTNKLKQQELGQIFLMEMVFAPGYLMPRIVGPLLASSIVYPTFSNMGVVDPRTADFGDDITIKDILPMGPITNPPNFILGMSTYNGEMAFTTIVRGTEDYKAMLDSFFDALIRELPEHIPGEISTVKEEVSAKKPAPEVIGAQVRKKPVSEA